MFDFFRHEKLRYLRGSIFINLNTFSSSGKKPKFVLRHLLFCIDTHTEQIINVAETGVIMSYQVGDGAGVSTLLVQIRVIPLLGRRATFMAAGYNLN